MIGDKRQSLCGIIASYMIVQPPRGHGGSQSSSLAFQHSENRQLIRNDVVASLIR